MQMESQVTLVSEVHVSQENTPNQGGDPGLVCSVTKEHRVKKPTRQWAAWTREEEENFFTALRQVGKNFEKITCRVQSKNKDQVRHYYYRLVRRMNKLLGPGLYLDAKNSKDTNAAMLRWWSLLEKYSCRASKLHLKPRRFKVFVEALEHQLLKDRKKKTKKRPSQVEKYSPTSPNTISSQGRVSGHDTHTVKLVLVDSQNIQKLGPGKGTFKRTTSMNINKSSNKGEMGKASRQRRKPGASSAAYKKWEKAAIDGVSLVADAAEHLEQADHGKVEYGNTSAGEKSVDAVNIEPSPLLNVHVERNINGNGKLKLQLFPIDDVTRRALEVDKHNPHLELTLSTRKKISSVLEHLIRKWGDSSAASGELMLFPYGAHMENILGHPRWTQTSNLSAADVYAMIGNPPVFRLRYGWFADTRIARMTCQAALPSMCTVHMRDINTAVRKDHIMEADQLPLPSTYEQSEKLVIKENQPTSRENSDDFEPPWTGIPNKMRVCPGNGSQNNIGIADAALRRREDSHRVMIAQMENEDDKKLSEVALSAGEWVDSLTNISVGDLLSDVPDAANANCVDPPATGGSQYIQQISFNCDSFDAAIAAHISRHQNKMGTPSKFESHATSIWDAEETCDAFSFQKNLVPSSSEVHAVSGPDSPQTTGAESGNLTEELPEREVPFTDSACDEPGRDSLSDSQILDSPVKDFNALTDVYWPDSLGPLDLDLPSSNYNSADLILGDSFGGLNGLIASSVDAFQNCSFFSLEKKPSHPPRKPE